jgi:hypothetical protein
MEILLDRSDGMSDPRNDGARLPDGTIPTRSYAAGLAVIEILTAFSQGDFYDINQLDKSGIMVSSGDEYDQKCPNAADRKVSIRIFKTDSPIDHAVPDTNLHWNYTQITQTPMFPSTDGFLAPADAFAAYKASDLWDKTYFTDTNGVVHKEGRPTEVNILPLSSTRPGAVVHFSVTADGMCFSARGFGQRPGSSSDLRQILTLSHGFEIASSQSGCRTDDITASNGMPPGALGSGGWGDNVRAEFASRGIEGHGVLFEGAQSPSAAAMLPSPADLIGGRSARAAALAVAPATAPAYTSANDLLFFQQLAAATGGKASGAIDTTPIAPTSGVTDTTTDTDGDGVPDFRDFCPFDMCQDIDGDQIPDSMDLCKFDQFEDGRGPFPADGCSDFDADGIIDGIDKCPLSAEDWYPPLPNDGCPRVVTVPTLPAATLGLLGFALLGLGITKLRRSRFAEKG